jgi:hypothetical protein
VTGSNIFTVLRNMFLTDFNISFMSKGEYVSVSANAVMATIDAFIRHFSFICAKYTTIHVRSCPTYCLLWEFGVSQFEAPIQTIAYCGSSGYPNLRLLNLGTLDIRTIYFAIKLLSRKSHLYSIKIKIHNYEPKILFSVIGLLKRGRLYILLRISGGEYVALYLCMSTVCIGV